MQRWKSDRASTTTASTNTGASALAPASVTCSPPPISANFNIFVHRLPGRGKLYEFAYFRICRRRLLIAFSASPPIQRISPD